MGIVNDIIREAALQLSYVCDVILKAGRAELEKQPTKTAKSILQDYLIANGYDGLYHENDCGCCIEELLWCNKTPGSCIPGHKVPGCKVVCDDYPCHDSECDYHIGPGEEEVKL